MNWFLSQKSLFLGLLSSAGVDKKKKKLVHRDMALSLCGLEKG